MRSSLSFRAKVLTIVASAAVSLLCLVVVGAFMANRVERQLVTIQATYVPKSELGPRLEARFDGLRRALQDAVAAHDGEALSRTAERRDAILDDLANSRKVLDPDEAASFQEAFLQYDSAARDVSHRLIADETGEGIVDAIAGMQAKQSVAVERLSKMAAFDPRELANAFESIRAAEVLAARTRMVLSLACLIAVLGLSTWISRDVLRSVGDLSAGFSRFGRGELDIPIPVSSGDELGRAAVAANRMAASLANLQEELRAQNDALNDLVRQLEERGQKLEETNGELDSFAYSISHDLRAPLRAIDGFAQILTEDYAAVLDDDGKRVLDVICKNTKKMGQLIDDLLTFSRLGRQPVASSEVDMTALARSVGEDACAAEPSRSIELSVGELPPCQGDPSLLRQLWTNLLTNAVKYSRPRDVARIDVSASTAGDEVVYRVRDNGVGFDDKYKEKLFGVFQRLHTVAEFEGTGVGLAIVHRIARRHGGWVAAESVLGEGASFSFAIAGKEEADGP